MHKLHTYEAPDAELLVVRFEGNILSPGIEDSTVTDVDDPYDDDNN